MIFKDVSELHNYSIELGKPKLFDEILDASLERAIKKATTTTSSRGCGDGGGRFKWFGEMSEPKPQEFLADPAMPKTFPLVMHGAGGSAKSYLMLLLAMIHASPAGGTWLGSTVNGNGKSLIVDFELNENVFNSRVRKIAKGLGVDHSNIPGLAYYEVGDLGTGESFDEVYELCREHGFDLVIIDSVGPALDGDASSSRDVIGFYRNRIATLGALGVTTGLVDHQARAYTEEEYQTRGVFGSGYKEHLARSIFQVQPRPAAEDSDTLVVRMRHKKANFTKLMKPFDVWLTFSEDSVCIERHDVEDGELIAEKTISLESRILSALRLHSNGTITDIAEWLDHSRGSVGNAVRDLKTQGRLIEVGKEGNALIYGLPYHEDKVVTTTISTTPREHGDGGSDDDDEARESTTISTTPREHGDGGPTNTVATVVFDADQLSKMAYHLSKAIGPIGFDVETYPQDDTARSLDPRRGKVAVVSLSTGSDTYVVDAKKLDAAAIRDALEQCLPNKPLIAHNAPFDLAFVRRAFGYEHDGPVYDTLVLDAMLFYATGPLTEKKGWKGFTLKDKDAGYKRSLKDVVQHRLGLELDKTEQSSDWSGELTPEMVYYAAADAEILIQLKDALVSELEALGMSRVVDLEARFTPAMAYASDNGFALDVEGWKQHAASARDAIAEALEECDKLAPEAPEGVDAWAWNASNHRKVGMALELLGAKVKKSPKGNYKTDEEALKGIKKPAKAKRLAEAILRYRTNEKYVTTWGDNWFQEPFLNTKGRVHQKSPDHLMVVDGRVHAKFNQLVASGRGSSKQPNMQNLPPEIRHYFVAPPGRKLLIADYSQLEYVAAAHIAGAEALLEPLREGRDFHQITAEMIGTDRARAKMVNFGVLYGMGSKALANKLGTSETKAFGHRNKLLSRAPELSKWCSKQEDKAYEAVPYATTALGRRRLVDMSRRVPYGYREGQEHLLGRWEGNRAQFLNHPIQGSCAEGYKIAGALLWERRREFKGNPLLVNMIHDEFVLEVDEAAAEADATLLEALMLQGMREVLGDAPARVDLKVADHWGEKD